MTPAAGLGLVEQCIAKKGRVDLEIAWSVAMFFNVARNEVDGRNYGEAS